MKFTRWFRQSLAARVVVSTSLFTTLIISVAGTVLYTQLSHGIRGVKYNSSISDTKATVFALQYQFLLTGDNPKAIRKSIDDLSTNGTVFGTATNTAPYLVFIPSPGTKIVKKDYTTISQFLTIGVIPKSLREAVEKNPSIQTEYRTVSNNYGIATEVLIVGNQIQVPGAGNYEIYLLYNLDNLKL